MDYIRLHPFIADTAYTLSRHIRRRAAFSRSAAFIVACFCSVLTLVGCRPRATTPQEVTATNSRAVPAATVAGSTAYRAAAERYRRGDAAGALAQIDALARNPSLTAADRSFLLHQQAICRARLGSKAPIAAHPSLVSTKTPSRPRALTAAQADCGPHALLLVCQHLHIPASLPVLRSAAGTTGAGTNLAGLVRAAQTVGLKAEGVQMDGAALANLNTEKTPALAWVDGNHYVAVLSIHDDTVTIHDPNKGMEEDISVATGPTGLLERSGGILLLLSRSGSDARKTLAATTPAVGRP